MPELSDSDVERIREELFAGRRIEAIKIYRQVTGVSLYHAKEFIDGLEVRMRVEFPGRMPQPVGCSFPVVVVVAAIVLSLAGALVWWLSR